MGNQLLSNSSPFNNVHNVYPMNYSPYMNINNNMCLNNNCNTVYNQFYVLNNNMVNNGSNNINSCYNSSYFQSCNGNNYTPSMYQNYDIHEDLTLHHRIVRVSQAERPHSLLPS